MTTWVRPEGGRERGPVALVRAWAAALVRPRQFFRLAVSPGDQAPGLVFAMVVAFVAVATRFALVPAQRPSYAGRPYLSLVLVGGLVVLVVTPLLLHLAAALETLSLIVVVRERAGVSETVQTVAYATAPCAFAGVPYPEVQFAAAAYGAVLLVVGTAVVHDTSFPRAVLASLLPGALVFGYAYGGLFALDALLVEHLGADAGFLRA